MNGKLRLATVGTGYFSEFQYRAWARIADVELVAVCSRDGEKARDFADLYSAKAAFSSIDEMLASTEIDVLDIITPPDSHLKIIEQAARRDIDIICQKPFCRNLDEAVSAVDIARASGVELIVHENFRFQPWYQAIKEILDRGDLGKIHQAQFNLRPGDGIGETAYMSRQPYFRQMPRFLMHETGIHFIDVFRFLFGEVRTVWASLRRLNNSIKGEDAGIVVFTMMDNVQVMFDGNRLLTHAAANRRRTMGEMIIEGEKASLGLDGEGVLRIRNADSNEWRQIVYEWTDIDFGGDCVYATQKAAIDGLLGRGPVVNSASEYLHNIRIEEAIYLSNEQGRRIDIQ